MKKSILLAIYFLLIPGFVFAVDFDPTNLDPCDVHRCSGRVIDPSNSYTRGTVLRHFYDEACLKNADPRVREIKCGRFEYETDAGEKKVVSAGVLRKDLSPEYARGRELFVRARRRSVGYKGNDSKKYYQKLIGNFKFAYWEDRSNSSMGYYTHYTYGYIDLSGKLNVDTAFLRHTFDFSPQPPGHYDRLGLYIKRNCHSVKVFEGNGLRRDAHTIPFCDGDSVYKSDEPEKKMFAVINNVYVQFLGDAPNYFAEIEYSYPDESLPRFSAATLRKGKIVLGRQYRRHDGWGQSIDDFRSPFYKVLPEKCQGKLCQGDRLFSVDGSNLAYKAIYFVQHFISACPAEMISIRERFDGSNEDRTWGINPFQDKVIQLDKECIDGFCMGQDYYYSGYTAERGPFRRRDKMSSMGSTGELMSFYFNPREDKILTNRVPIELLYKRTSKTRIPPFVVLGAFAKVPCTYVSGRVLSIMKNGLGHEAVEIGRERLSIGLYVDDILYIPGAMRAPVDDCDFI